MTTTMIAMFVVFGLMIGILFGFFGMGGSFLVTPALLVLGYKPQVAVGSGLAFVFGTSVIAALRHRNLGQVDYKLGALFIVGMTAGIEVGKEIIFLLEELGQADLFVSVAYVVLLGGVGLFVFRDSRSSDDSGGDSDGKFAIAERLQRYQIPPTVTLKGGVKISVWLTLLIAALIGVLAGFLGVGGGFLLMPAMVYVLGVPAAVAVGTDVFQIVASGGVGAFLYAQSGSVDLGAVASLLAGSALGARIGSAATSLVDEDDIKIYFAMMLLAGSVAVASKKIGNGLGIDLFNTVSIALIVGAALLVSSAVVITALQALRQQGSTPTPTAD